MGSVVALRRVQGGACQEVSALGLPSESGVLIVQAKPDSATAKQGLKTGDVILKSNWKPVHMAADLISAYTSSAERAPLNMMRDQADVLVEIKTGLGE